VEDERLVGRRLVAEMLGVSAATVDRLEAAGVIPRRRRLSAARVGWLHSELVAVLRNLPEGALTARTAAARAPEARARAAKTREANAARGVVGDPAA